MGTDTVIEPLLAVIPLNIILTIYLLKVYARSEHFNRKFLRLVFAVTAGLFADVLFLLSLSGALNRDGRIQLSLFYLRQACFAFVCAALMDYIILDEGGPLDETLRLLRRLLLGGFFYAQIVTYFTGHNARIGENEIEYGISSRLFSFTVPLLFACFTAVCVLLQRKRQGRERMLTLLLIFAVSVAVFALRHFFFEELPLDLLVAGCDVYILFFAIETPAYAQVEEAFDTLKRAETDARKAQEEARKADEEMSAFLANISHEIRTPLTTILGMNESILSRYSEGPIYEHARDIESAGQSLVHIINDILDFSKIESGELELAVRDYHLGQVLRDVDNMIRIRAGQKGLGFISQIDHTLPDELHGDRIRIQQVMVNLLNNGVKYTKKGHVKLQIAGERGNDPSYLTLHITVSDTGIGIREEDLPKLFQSFQRIDLEETHGIEGTGLGLAITGRLITLMGGTVDVQSVYGQGTSFHVTLPQRVTGKMTLQDFEERETRAPSRNLNEFTAPFAKILIVDDNRMNRVVLQSLLAPTQVQVDQAESGEDALSLCKAKRYDLILMDYMMPVMDGLETLQRLRDMTDAPSCQAKVVVCTANAVVGVRAKLLSAGFDDFLSKPVNSAELREILEKFLKTDNSTDQARSRPAE